jgi:hypothetical protein
MKLTARRGYSHTFQAECRGFDSRPTRHSRRRGRTAKYPKRREHYKFQYGGADGRDKAQNPQKRTGIFYRSNQGNEADLWLAGDSEMNCVAALISPMSWSEYRLAGGTLAGTVDGKARFASTNPDI